jgi:hypothetical protein
MAGSIIENKSGRIASYYDADSGVITEDGSGANLDFYQEGAQVVHPVPGPVVFLKVITPSGKVIIKDIKKP